MKNIHTIVVESWIHCPQEFHRRGRNYTREEKTPSDNGYIPYSTEKILDYLRPAGILLHPWQLTPPCEITRLNVKLPNLHTPPLPRACTLNPAHTLRKMFTRNQVTSFQDHPAAMEQAQ